MEEKPKRLAPTIETLRSLFARSGNQCAFPDCDHPLVDEENIFVAQVCHIEDAKSGCRFNLKMTNEERRSYDNLILFCYRHHVQTNNEEKFPTHILKEIKAKHEVQFKEDFKLSNSILRNIYDALPRLFHELSEIKTDTSETLKTVTKSDKKLDLLISKLSKEREDRIDEKGKFLNEIESIIKLRETNNQKVAIKLYKDLKEKNWEHFSGLEKYKLTGNVGICLLDLEKDKEAAQYFIEAITYDPKNERGWGLAALGHAILGQKLDSHKFIEKLITKNPNNITAYVALIAINKGELSISRLLAKIPNEVRENSEISFALGMEARNIGDFESAIYWLQNSVDLAEKKDGEIKANLATIILESVTDPFQIIIGQIDNEVVNKIKYSIQLFTDAWEIFKNSELRATKAWILANRAQAKRFIKDYKGAQEDLIEAKNINNNKYIPIKSLAILAFETNQLDEALDLIEELKLLDSSADKEEFDSELFKAIVLYKQGESSKSIKILKYLINNTTKQKIIEVAQSTLIQVYIEQNNIDDAKDLSSSIIDQYPDYLRGYLDSALIYAKTNENEKALTFLDIAFSKISDETDHVDIQDIAFQYLNHKEYVKAINLLERITNPDIYTNLSQTLLDAYYSGGELQKALDLCSSFRKNYGPIDLVTEIQSSIYESIQDLPKAIDVCKEFLKVYPDDQRIQIRLAIIYYRIKDADKVKELLSDLGVLGELPLDILYKLAYLNISVGELNRGLEIAFETRRKYRNIGDAHLKYFGIIAELHSLSDHLGEFSEVKVDTAVKIKDENNEIQTYYILDETEKVTKEELLLTDKLAQSLFGAKVGDVITIDRNVGEPQKYTVESILSKFIYAFQESIQLLDKRFIEVEGVRSFTIGQSGDIKSDFKPIFDSLDQADKFDNQIFDLYKQKKLPIGVCSQIKKINPIRFWASVMGNKDIGLFSIGTNRTELPNALLQLEKGEGLVVDLISLLTLDSIQKLDLLEAIPNNKVIARSVLECIDDLLRDFKGISSEGYSTLGKVDGKYVNEEKTKEQVEYHREHYENLLN